MSISAGANFWRKPARKFFAIPQEDVNGGQHRPASAKKRKSRRTVARTINLDTSDDSDSDFQSTRPAKIMRCQCKEGMLNIQQKLDRVLSLTPRSKIPLGLKFVMEECFTCTICKGFPIQPPVIFAKCCRSIIGCEACVHTWYSGERSYD